MNIQIKYPRTYHLPWSLGTTNDDKKLQSIDQFVGRRVVITEKMDGENTSIYNNTIHARSLDSRNHLSRNWVKQFAQSFQWQLSIDTRICGENLYAKHSIVYNNLESFFLAFSIWHKNSCLAWDETVLMLDALNVPRVKVLYDGIFDEKLIKALWSDGDSSEGYVVRVADEFDIEDFSNLVGKFVRKDHVQSNGHWMNKEIIQNHLS